MALLERLAFVLILLVHILVVLIFSFKIIISFFWVGALLSVVHVARLDILQL